MHSAIGKWLFTYERTVPVNIVASDFVEANFARSVIQQNYVPDNEDFDQSVAAPASSSCCKKADVSMTFAITNI